MRNVCPDCGTENQDHSLACAMCSQVLDRPRAGVPPLPPIPHDILEAEFHADNARRFALILPGGLAVWSLLVWLGAQGAYPDALAPFFTQAHFGLLMKLSAMVLAAFAAASTAEACCAPFWPCFLAALFPPAIPGVLAHAARRPVLENYVYLLAETIIVYLLLIVMAGRLGTATGALAFAGIIALAPLILYSLCGGGVRELALRLGLEPTRALAWVCLGPPAIQLFHLAERGLIRSLNQSGVAPPSRGGPLAARLAAQFYDPVTTGPFSLLCVISFALATLFIWTRAVHDTLGNPPKLKE